MTPPGGFPVPGPELRRHGLGLHEAVMGAGRTRLRPILMTISTMLALVLIPTLYVMLEERFPRRAPVPEGEPLLQGDPA